MDQLTTVDGVDGRACNEESFECVVFVDSVQAKRHVEKNGKAVFAAVDQMRKRISGIIVTAQTLQCTPNAWHGRKEAEKP